MSRVLHCSDLHFGRGFERRQAAKLVEQMQALRPAAVVISGDVTMRARAGQYREVRAIIEQMPAPRLIIPGNHDIPLYNVPLRLTRPFRNYDRYISDLSTNPIELTNVALIGLNTINPWRHQKGRITERDLAAAAAYIRSLSSDDWRVIVVHQHFSNLQGNERPGRMHSASSVLDEFSRAGAHLVLCGHTHFCHVGSTADYFPNLSRPMLIVNAGSATSCRTRAAESGPKSNTFNVLEFESDRVVVRSMNWEPEKDDFAEYASREFPRSFFQGKASS